MGPRRFLASDAVDYQNTRPWRPASLDQVQHGQALVNVVKPGLHSVLP